MIELELLPWRRVRVWCVCVVWVGRYLVFLPRPREHLEQRLGGALRRDGEGRLSVARFAGGVGAVVEEPLRGRGRADRRREVERSATVGVGHVDRGRRRHRVQHRAERL